MSEQRILNGKTPHRLYRPQYTFLLVGCLVLLALGALTGALFGLLRWTTAAEAVMALGALMLVFYGCHRALYSRR